MKNILSLAALGVGLTLSAFTANAQELCGAPAANAPDITNSVKWYRDSAEQKALYRQTYAIASAYVKNWAQQNQAQGKPWGVILDIDETTLSNSWYAHDCQRWTSTDPDFSRFVVNAKRSAALPGAAKFTHLVHELGGQVTLISNRDGTYVDANGSVVNNTIANLKSSNIYFDQILFANQRDSKDWSDKNPRFQAVATGNYDLKKMVLASDKLPPYQVVAFVGDNIQDFPHLTQANMVKQNADGSKFDEFGAGYFILPNPMGGSWQHNKDA